VIERIKSVLFWTFVILFVVLLIGDKLLHGSDGPHEGQNCGPNHKWVYVGIGEDKDLSCEELKPQ
jgi:hypothetical protein